MWYMNDVIKIEHKEDFIFRVVFDDGKSGDVDFFCYFGRGPVFEPLRDKSFFRKAKTEGGTIAWPTVLITPRNHFTKKGEFNLQVHHNR